MLVAESAILLVFDSTRLLPLVLGCRIIAVFANSAFERDYVSHILSLIRRRPPEDFRGVARAHDGTRTRDLRLTKALLYQLSYVSGHNIKKENRRAGIMPCAAHLTRPLGALGDNRCLSEAALRTRAGDGTRTRDQQLGRL